MNNKNIIRWRGFGLFSHENSSKVTYKRTTPKNQSFWNYQLTEYVWVINARGVNGNTFLFKCDNYGIRRLHSHVFEKNSKFCFLKKSNYNPFLGKVKPYSDFKAYIISLSQCIFAPSARLSNRSFLINSFRSFYGLQTKTAKPFYDTALP